MRALSLLVQKIQRQEHAVICLRCWITLMEQVIRHTLFFFFFGQGLCWAVGTRIQCLWCLGIWAGDFLSWDGGGRGWRDGL